MKWPRIFTREAGNKAAEIVTGHAAQKIAITIADRVGPHRFLSKAGLVLIVLGIAIALAGWLFATSWLYWTAIISGALLIVAGYAMRGFNSLLVSLLARLLKSIARRVYNFAAPRLKRLWQSRTVRSGTQQPKDDSSTPPR